MNKYILPIGAGVGVLAATGIALRIHSVAKAKAASAVTAAAGTPVAQVSANAGVAPAQLEKAAAAAGTTPAAIAADPNSAASQAVLQAAQAVPVASLPQARVVTNDPPPSGDLAIRSAPNNSAPIIGGADKDGTVTILNQDASSDGLFAEVQWDGGRNSAVSGFAHKTVLRLI